MATVPMPIAYLSASLWSTHCWLLSLQWPAAQGTTACETRPNMLSMEWDQTGPAGGSHMGADAEGGGDLDEWGKWVMSSRCKQCSNAGQLVCVLVGMLRGWEMG